MDNTHIQVVESTWIADGQELHVVALPEVDVASSDDAVTALQTALGCSWLEAQHAYRVIVEDGEFVASVVGDIDRL